MKIHFISIGGAVMHNLAIALHKKGWKVTGSDDEIFEPAKSRLKKYNLLPEHSGWDSSKITPELDMVVLGMHARMDNPELKKALELNLEIKSFPQLIYETAKDKIRIGIAGSHGKTTITAMIMHVLKKIEFDFDYLVGSVVEGFEDSVRITENARVMVIEADEYLSSVLDKRPKFLWYKPQIALINGIAWDHVNVFPSFEIYKNQFREFISSLPEKAFLAYNKTDREVKALVNEFPDIQKKGYHYPDYFVKDNTIYLNYLNRELRLSFQGIHNLLNMEGARTVLSQLNITPEVFYTAMQDFHGAGKRLELLYKSDNLIVFRDFAHAPSKLKATVESIKKQYPEYSIVAVFELHTYSSLNPDFLPQYRGTLDEADTPVVFIDRHAVELKKMKMPEENQVKEAFGSKRIKVFYDSDSLFEFLIQPMKKPMAMLLMSSGKFGQLDISALIESIRKSQS